MPDENGKKKQPFKVTISDEDYMSPNELDFFLENNRKENPQKDSLDVPSSGKKPKFEVHIDDDDLLTYSPDDSQPEYKGEIYFSNVKPVKHNEQVTPAKKKPIKRQTAYSALALFAAVTVLLTSCLSVFAISCINDVVAFGRSEDTVTITVPLDADTNDIIDLLSDEGLIKQKAFCKLFYNTIDKIKNMNKKTVKEPVYLSGVYDVEKNLGLEGFLYEFRETQKGKDTVTVSIPEGWSAYQIFERLEKYGVCKKQRLISSMTGTAFEYDFCKDIKNSSSRVFMLEGYLYPNTYEFYVDSDANSVIRKFLDESELKWTDEYQDQADKLGRTMDEIMIIASIIQREAANTEQMADISSVIHNRLNHSASWPTICCDSTETYIDKFVTPNVTAAQSLLFAQMYNTYNNAGLPPGPICNPGDDAINAALFPNDTNYYFFRHDKNGKIYLAVTQAEHDANANVVLRVNNQ